MATDGPSHRGACRLAHIGAGLIGCWLLAALASAQPVPDAAALMAQMHAAMGGAQLDRLAGVAVSGRYVMGGLPGTFRQLVDFRAGRDVLDYDVGVTSGVQASGRNFSWWVDEKGLANIDDTPEELAEAATESYQDRNGWLYFDPAVPASYTGSQSQDGRSFDLLSVTPPGGRELTLWIDAQTHLPDRIIEHDIEQEDDVTYLSDYRQVQGVWFPFRQRESTGDPRTDVLLVVQSLRWLTQVDDSRFAPPLSQIVDASLPRGISSVTLPFTLHDGMVIVQASVNGSAPLPFALDSGGMNSFTPATAARLGLTLVGNFSLNGVGARLVDAQLAHVTSLRLGALQLSNQQCLVIPLPTSLTNRGQREPLAGLIGYELFRRFQVTIDYQRRLVTLSPPGTPAQGERLPLRFEGRRPFVLASVDGTNGYFGVDTGDDGALTLFRRFYDSHGFPIELPGIDSGQGGVGGYNPTLLTRVASLSMGELTLPHPLAELNFATAGAFASDFSAGNIGAQVLQNFVVTLDYADRALYLRPSSEFGQEMAYNRSGIVFELSDAGALVVESVASGSPAALAGVRAGDQLLAVNDRNALDEDYASLQDDLRQRAGTRVALQLLRHGKRQSLSFTLQEMLPPERCCRGLLGQQPPALSADRQAGAIQ